MSRARLLAIVAAAVGIAGAFAAGGIALASSQSVTGPDPAALAGSELAVVVPTVHTANHTAVTTVTVGTTVHLRVAVSGTFGTPTGKVFGWYWPNATCLGEPVPTFYANLTSGVVDTSWTYIPQAANKMSFRVRYYGDATYAERSSACTAINVTKATPSVGLTLHDSAHAAATSVLTWSMVHPLVSVQSRVGTPTGLFQVFWWPNETCIGAPYDETEKLAVGSKMDVTIFAQKAMPAGWNSFRVHYDGDLGFKAADSACVKVQVKKRDPKVAREIHDAAHEPASEVPVGAAVHPWASATGPLGIPAPTGEFEIHQYDSWSCIGPATKVTKAPAGQDADMTALAITRAKPGSVHWKIYYFGDSVYGANLGDCMHATWKAATQTTIFARTTSGTTVTKVTAGKPFYFRAEVATDFSTATGTVTVKLFENDHCGGAGSTIAAVNLAAGGAGDDVAHEHVVDTPGKVSFKGNYTGDAFHFGDTSGCLVLTVAAPKPRPTATPTPTGTSKPAATPKATAEPASSETPASGATPAAATAPAPTESGATASPTPGATAGASTSPGGGATAGPSAPLGGTAPEVPAGSAGEAPGFPWWLLLLLLLIVGVGVLVGRRSRRPS